MSEKEYTPKNEQGLSLETPVQQEKNLSQEEVVEKPETMESLETRMVEIETALEQLEELENLPPEELKFVAEALEKSPEGKNAIQRLQKATENVLLASHHLSSNLSERIDPRLVKAIGMIGKITGGMGSGIIGGPIASVAGSKAGEYLALKSLHKMESRLPERLRNTVEKPENLEKIEAGEQLIEKELEGLKEAERELDDVTEEIEKLPEAEKAQFLENLSNDTDNISAVERMKDAYKHMGEFYEGVETKHPILGTATEMAMHSLLGPALEVVEVGEHAIHLIEVFGGPAVEKANLIALSAFGSAKEAILSTKGIARRFLDRKKAE